MTSGEVGRRDLRVPASDASGKSRVVQGDVPPLIYNSLQPRPPEPASGQAPDPWPPWWGAAGRSSTHPAAGCLRRSFLDRARSHGPAHHVSRRARTVAGDSRPAVQRMLQNRTDFTWRPAAGTRGGRWSWMTAWGCKSPRTRPWRTSFWPTAPRPLGLPPPVSLPPPPSLPLLPPSARAPTTLEETSSDSCVGKPEADSKASC